MTHKFRTQAPSPPTQPSPPRSPKPPPPPLPPPSPAPSQQQQQQQQLRQQRCTPTETRQNKHAKRDPNVRNPFAKICDQEKRANRSSHITPKSALRPRCGHDLDAQTVLQHCGRLAKHYPCLHAHHCNDRFTPPFMNYIQIASPVHRTQ